MSKIKNEGIENDNINFEIGLNAHSNRILFSKLIFLLIDKNLFKLKIIIEISMINIINNKWWIGYCPIQL